ncbi:MAG: ankyrin repeat domain-containing protein [Acetobacteraceae bacterium]|nr:ankyrin repeat domain-containing protein [Acetobacteraceae bacterium]
MRTSLAALAVLLLPATALAQITPQTVGRQPQQQQQQAPAALPGTAGRVTAPVIPRDPGEAALSPNAALFDAINRNDLAAARDAVARGASLSARNVLGLTPIDAAVDQGRSEIAFFLLQARALEGRRAEPAPEPAARQPAAPAPRIVAAPARPAEAQRPRLFAGDGGAAQPEIGFLGFDQASTRRR